MEKKVARINWSHGQFSDVYRSTIVNPSPLKPGQKVKVLRGKTKKEHKAVSESYSIVEEQQTPTSQEELPRRRARAKRKLVSLNLFDTTHHNCMCLELYVYMYDLKNLSLNYRSQSRLLLQRMRDPGRKNKQKKTRKQHQKTRRGERYVPINVANFFGSCRCHHRSLSGIHFTVL